MKTFETLPRDVNGIIQGAWRVVHKSASFEGSVGPVNFIKGRANRPMTGQPLARFMAGMAGSVTCEPWDPTAEEAAPAPAPVPSKPKNMFGPSGPPGSLPATEGNREQIQAEKADADKAAALAASEAWVEKNKDPRWSGAAPRKAPELPAKSKKGRRKKAMSARANAPVKDEWDDISDSSVLEAIASGMGIDVTKFKGASSLRSEMRRVQAEQ